jgi:hypothetical protein
LRTASLCTFDITRGFNPENLTMAINKSNSRRGWAAVAMALILGLVLVWWFQYTGDSASDIADVNGTDETAVTDESHNDSPDDPAEQPAQIEELPTSTALEQFKQRTRYPATTRRIAADSHDLLNPGARYEQRHKLPGDKNNPNLDWQVLFTADRFFVRGKEPLLVSLQLWHRGEQVLPAQVSMRAETVAADETKKSVRLVTQVDGNARTVVFTPNSHWPDYVGQVRVTAEFSAEGLEKQHGSLDFFFTGANRIPAVFTGRIHDRLDNGDLLFDIEVDVKSPGAYRIDGSLFDSSGLPFGWARFEGSLARGSALVSLRYYGLLFHDAEAAGPYTLKNLNGARLRPGDTPHKEDMPEPAGDYTTTSYYELNRFRADINNSPRRQKMIEMYEDAIRRGVKLTDPAYTGNE